MRSFKNDHYDEKLTIEDFEWITVVYQNGIGPKWRSMRPVSTGGLKWAVQRVESGRSRVSGQSIQKWMALSQYGRTFELTSTVQDDSERSFDPKWTVCRLKMDSPNESNDNSWRSINDDVICLEVWKWTIQKMKYWKWTTQKYKIWRFSIKKDRSLWPETVQIALD